MTEDDFNLLHILNRTQNITQAAERLYITQSAVSKRIQQIEKELNVTLLLRSRQGVHFTAEGEIILQHVQEAMKSMENMRKAIRQYKGDIAGSLKVGSSINYSLYRLPAQLAEYQRRYPEVITKIVAGSSKDIFGKLIRDKLDIAIVRGEFDWFGEKILLDREQLCAIVHPKFDGIPFTELPQVIRQTATDMEPQITRWLRENSIPNAQNTLEVTNTATCVEMVKQGIGWGIVPEICLENFNGRIYPLNFKNGEPLLRSTYIMYTKKIMELPQAKVFVELIKEFTCRKD